MSPMRRMRRIRTSCNSRLHAIRTKPFVRSRNPIPQWNRWLPAEVAKPRDIQKLSRRAVRLRCVAGQITIETDHIADQLRQFANRNVLAAADIDDLWRVIFLQQ